MDVLRGTQTIHSRASWAKNRTILHAQLSTVSTSYSRGGTQALMTRTHPTCVHVETHLDVLRVETLADIIAPLVQKGALRREATHALPKASHTLLGWKNADDDERDSHAVHRFGSARHRLNSSARSGVMRGGAHANSSRLASGTQLAKRTNQIQSAS